MEKFIFCAVYDEGLWNTCALKSKVLRYITYKSRRPVVFSKIGLFKSLGKFTEKHLYRSLFFNKVASLRPALY